MLPAELRVSLRDGADALGCSLTDVQANALLAYLELLLKWSRVYNLTAVRQPGQMLTHHLLDCLSVVAPLRRFVGDRSRRLLDVGSGAGLPGVVLAVMLPNLDVTCVDAVAKKAGFVRQAGAELRLPNLHAKHGRAEVIDEEAFDLVTCRAFSSLAELVRLTRAHVSPAGVWLAMKGRFPVDEVSQVPADIDVFHVEQVHVPGLDAERCLVWMRAKLPSQ
jgi:16S rRNA (guanine527-N7)-methyltransferase